MSPNTPTVSAYYARWRALYKKDSGITAKSLASYDEKFRKYILPAVGDLPLPAVTDGDLQAILNASAGMSYSHLSKLRSLMQQLFSRALRSRLIAYNPADGLELPACTRRSRRSLTERERRLLLETEPLVPGAVLFYAMLMTGMRPGELAVLRWSDVDFEKGEITVSRALESGTQRTIRGPKTEAGNRLIPMRRALAARLAPLRAAPEAYVFPRADGSHHSHNSLYRLWHRLRAEMESRGGPLPPDLVPYCLRHTFCTDLQNAGVPINVAKELMGHSNISTTANVYTHRDDKTLHRSIARLDRPKKVAVQKRKKPRPTPKPTRRAPVGADTIRSPRHTPRPTKPPRPKPPLCKGGCHAHGVTGGL